MAVRVSSQFGTMVEHLAKGTVEDGNPVVAGFYSRNLILLPEKLNGQSRSVAVEAINSNR